MFSVRVKRREENEYSHEPPMAAIRDGSSSPDNPDPIYSINALMSLPPSS